MSASHVLLSFSRVVMEAAISASLRPDGSPSAMCACVRVPMCVFQS